MSIPHSTPQQDTPMTREQELAAIKVLTDQLLAMAATAPTHRLMLIALLSMYQGIAATHPCCTESAAKSALRVGGELLIGAMQQAPTGPVH